MHETARFAFVESSQRNRTCRLCDGDIAAGEGSVVLKNCKLPGRGGLGSDLHFHKTCFVLGVANMKL